MIGLLNRAKTYASRHASKGAPKDTPCVDCDKREPEVTLARCSICEAWRCTQCFSMHRGPDSLYKPASKKTWWRRVIGRG